MANLVVTSTTNSIKVDFNDTPFMDRVEGASWNKGTWNKSEISSIRLNSHYIRVNTKDETAWLVADSAYDNYAVIDTVDGVAPTSLSDLYDKLVALIA